MEAGERLGGRSVTDRRARGPVFDVVALAVDDTPTHLALCFPEAVRAHAWFGDGLREHVQSLAWPGVLGVAALVQAEAERGVLVYETGPAVPLAHVFERLSSEGRPLGVRASLELAYLCTDILAQSNPSLGPHGQISPWTVGLTRRGRAVLLGYGVPCLELDLDQPGTGFAMREDSLRYAPPERFSADPEGLTSDLFSLWLLVAEGVLGRPLYDGVLEDLRHLARRGEAATRWFPHRDEVSPELHEQITAGLKPDADARPQDAEQLVHDLYGLARRFDADGPSLADVLHELGEGEADVPLPSPGIGTANAIQALDPDARWEGRSAKSLYDPTTGVTEMDRTSVADPENDVTEVSSASRSRADRREALRERLRTDPSTTTAIHGMTDYVALDPIDESGAGPGQGTTAIVERPDIAPSAQPADVRWQVVSHRGRAVRVPVFDTDRVATVALRAAMEHGALSVDTSGK
ncbi:MAG: hypothetical protein AAF602_12845, partial [Myxococcota bacterium]